MNMHTLMLENNECYRVGKMMTPKGIFMHSTGANNPNLNRYVGPDDGILGRSKYNNHWNIRFPDGRSICPHGFIGKLPDGTVATYQTLPWNMVGWHSGKGENGSANYMGYIGIEICEDALNDVDYAEAAFAEFIEVAAYLCHTYNISPENVISHKEGHAKGIASNHGDPENWFAALSKITGKLITMDDIRDNIKRKIDEKYGSKIKQKFTYIFAGSFDNKYIADDFLKTVRKTVPTAYVRSVNNKYVVQIGAFASEENAERYIATMPLNIREHIHTVRM